MASGRSCSARCSGSGTRGDGGSTWSTSTSGAASTRSRRSAGSAATTSWSCGSRPPWAATCRSSRSWPAGSPSGDCRSTDSLAVPGRATARRPHCQEERVREQLVVVALGGNAISPPGSASPIPAQYQRTMETADHLAHLTARPLVVSHGNGPQVGNVLLRSDLAAGLLPRLPLDTCVADTQGRMGFMLHQCLDNAFRQARVTRSTVAVVTRALVDADDPAFRSPSKPIGNFYDEAEARRRMATSGWAMREDAGRGWRRVVPSPEPREILELPAIEALLGTGAVVVAAGGGGIPVVREADGTLTGVEAVVDKDLASALLAANLGAEVLLVLTGVEHVAVDFGRPTRRDLHELDAATLAAHATDGHFAPGSMLPKVQAVLRFLSGGGRRAVITTPELSEKALAGEIGTQVIP